jgi:hypothetical protein
LCSRTAINVGKASSPSGNRNGPMNFDLSFNPYQVLGVSPKASEEEVREA